MSLIESQTQDRIHFISLNRPDKRNALSHQLVSDLKRAFKEAEEDEDSKIIVLRAEGKVFSAGADLAYIEQLQKNSYEENLEDSNHLRELFEMIYRHPKPVIAQVHGHAIAGGCGLASVCDFTIAASEAKFGYTEVKIGFVPALVSVFLIRKIGEGKAKEMLLTGKLYSAEQALKMGLINEVVGRDQLEETTLLLARELIEGNSGESMALTKKLIADIPELELSKALQMASETNALARSSEDCKKGIAAFLNKEKVMW